MVYKVKTIKEFFDKENGNILRKVGTIFECEKNRSRFLKEKNVVEILDEERSEGEQSSDASDDNAKKVSKKVKK